MAQLRNPYVLTVLLIGAATILGKTLLSHVAPTNQVMLYLLAVVMSALWWGRNATILASLLGVLAFDVFFVPPLYHFTVADAEYLITFSALLIVALAIGSLTGRLREHACALQAREQETASLYSFSKRLAAARDLLEVSSAVVEQIKDTFGWRSALETSEDELVGDVISGGLRLPLHTTAGEVGTLVIACPEDPLDASRKRLLEGLLAQAAVAVERAQLAKVAQRADLLVEAEKLHDALLHSISHALRTPLASIIGSLSTLLDPRQQNLDAAIRRDLVETAREEAERLNGLVGNLLDMTRLEAGHLKLLIDLYDVADVIGAAFSQAERSLRGRQVRVEMPADLPLVPLDQVLIVQVLENLLSNAARYSPSSAPIDIGVREMPGAVEVRVADRGPGIPANQLERVFEKFYRVERPGSPAGTGLGLAICKGIVEAHHGFIQAEVREGGGTVISFTLPLLERR